MAERASRTSSSLNGLMIAVTNFIFRPSKGDASLAKRDRQESERLLHESSSSRSADVFSGEGVDRAVGVGIAVVILPADMAEERPLFRERVRRREIQVPSAPGVRRAECARADTVGKLEGHPLPRARDVELGRVGILETGVVTAWV